MTATYLTSIVFILGAVLPVALAAPGQWNGFFSDPMYGGNISVCVTQTPGSVYYAQAVISNLGYMRGTINSNTNTWAGQFWLSGFEAKNGDFSLTLAGNGNSYSGTFTEKPGSKLIVTTSGDRVASDSTPSDTDCFKTDSSFLTTSTYTDYTGTYYEPGDNYPWSESTNSETAMYTGSYEYPYSDGSIIPGVDFGPIFLNGQVATFNWYEPGSDEGIGIQVAKNATSFYSLWWFFSRVSDFDYTLKDEDFYGQDFSIRDNSVSTADSETKAVSNMCYMLSTDSAEESCLESYSDDNSGGSNSGGSSSSNNNDDEADQTLSMATAAFVFAFFTFLLLVGMIIFMCTRKAPAVPVASLAATPPTINPVQGTSV